MAADERDDDELTLGGVSAPARALARLRPLPPAVVARLGGVLRADELEAIYTSNAIEGSTLTLRETELVVEQGITIGGKPLKDHLAAVNLAAALQQIKDIARGGPPLTEAMALDLHRIVLTRIDDANAGRYRHDPVRIVGATHAPPNARRVPDVMAALWDDYARRADHDHPVLVAADLHERIAAIHPFIDGNGRTARLVMNLHLLRYGYPLTIIPAERDMRLAYYEALGVAAANQDPTLFRAFVIDRVADMLDRYHAIAQEEGLLWNDTGQDRA